MMSKRTPVKEYADKRLCVCLTQKEHDYLRKLAYEKNTSMANVLMSYFRKQEKKGLRRDDSVIQ